MSVDLRETAARLRKLADALEECEADEFYFAYFSILTNETGQFDEVTNVISRVFPEARVRTVEGANGPQRILCLVDPPGNTWCPLNLNIADMSEVRV